MQAAQVHETCAACISFRRLRVNRYGKTNGRWKTPVAAVTKCDWKSTEIKMIPMGHPFKRAAGKDNWFPDDGGERTARDHLIVQ